MGPLKKIVGFPFWLAKAWAIGMSKLWRNEQHPHPAARTACLVIIVILFALGAYLLPLLHAAGMIFKLAVATVILLAVGMVSYFFNHAWKDAFL